MMWNNFSDHAIKVDGGQGIKTLHTKRSVINFKHWRLPPNRTKRIKKKKKDNVFPFGQVVSKFCVGAGFRWWEWKDLNEREYSQANLDMTSIPMTGNPLECSNESPVHQVTRPWSKSTWNQTTFQELMLFNWIFTSRFATNSMYKVIL